MVTRAGAARSSLRIAYVCADRGIAPCGRSGSAIHVREFVRGLRGRGVGVTLLAAGARGEGKRESFPCPIVDLEKDPTLNALRARMAKGLRAAGQNGPRAAETYGLLLNQTLLEELERRRRRIDLVYERQSLWSFAGLQFARRHGIPFCLEVNAPLTAQQVRYRELDMTEAAAAIERYVLSGADRVIVTSPALADYVHAHGGSRRKVRVIPCGVSRHLFDVTPARRVREEFVIGFVGSLKPWHGLDILLEAFHELHARSGAYRLLVVGDGPLLPWVRSFCAQNRLGAAVTLVGSVEHARIGHHLARMHAGVAPYPDLPSFYFSPLKVWEYAAAGVPLVASASGELPELFPHREAALLHAPGRVAKIVKHIEKLRCNPELGPRLARRARRVAKLHTWDRLAARFETIGRGLVRARQRRAGKEG